MVRNMIFVRYSVYKYKIIDFPIPIFSIFLAVLDDLKVTLTFKEIEKRLW